MGISVNQWEVAAEANNDQTSHFPQIVQHFDWLVAENCMKCEVVHPQEGVYDFTLADQFVNKALASGCHVVGHCLIWHSQLAPWFFTDAEGKQVSAEVLKKRMREHIFTILGHFRGRVEAWDVVNEAFEDDGSLRRSKFYEILGEDYIPLAFQYAHEADPNVELYYNDYSMNKATKVEGVVNFFRPLLAKGMPLTAIGLQGHLILGDSDYLTEYEHAVETIASLGVKAQFTELDLVAIQQLLYQTAHGITQNALHCSSGERAVMAGNVIHELRERHVLAHLRLGVSLWRGSLIHRIWLLVNRIINHGFKSVWVKRK
jgi:GH35 family endo-1,4-beta-xylanase